MNMNNAICDKNEQCMTWPMDVEDVPTIIRIHMDSFANFFLTFLGPAFLKELYVGTIEVLCSDSACRRSFVTSAIGGECQKICKRQFLKARTFAPSC